MSLSIEQIFEYRPPQTRPETSQKPAEKQDQKAGSQSAK